MVQIDWSKPSLFLFIARRNSGKSVAMSYLYHHFKNKFHAVFVCCPTEKTGEGFWRKQGVKEENIRTTYTDEWGTLLCEKLMEQNKGKSPDKAFKTLLILDDMANENTKLHDIKSLRLIAGRGRHFHLSVVVSAQTLTGCPPVLRINADAVCVGRINRASLELLEKECNVGMNKRDFIKMVDNIPPYSFLVINNVSSKSGSNVEDNYGVFQVPEEYAKKL
jgi:hypothetical protein